MILDPAEPVIPSLELTALLAGPGPKELTVQDAPPNDAHQSVVSRNRRHTTMPDDAERTVRILTAMLAPEPDGWTINGTRARIIKPPLPDVCVMLSVHTPNGWHRTAVNSKPDLLPNCRVDGILTWLPGLEPLAENYLCQLPSPSQHWNPAGRVTLQPMPRFKAGELLLDQPKTPDDRTITEKIRRMLPELRRMANTQLRNARQHPLTPPPAPDKAWIRPRHNDPREASPYRRDAAIIIVHSRPVILHDNGQHSQAERTSALIAVEMANTKIVPVAAPYPDNDERAHEMMFTISGQQLTLSPDKENGKRRSLPILLLAQGRYRPHRQPPMKAKLMPGFRPEEDELCDMLVRCYEPDALTTVSTAQAMRSGQSLMEHARQTARLLLKR